MGRLMESPRNYTRWTAGARADDPITADILGDVTITVDTPGRQVVATGIDGESMNPDMARMIGVRLIEGAALADGDRAIRKAGP
jgi:hypothetical protein